jgi:hypothetical protein
VAVGLGCAGAGLYARERAAHSDTLVATRGEVVTARAHKSNDWWHLDIEFEYQLHNRSYVGRDSRLLRNSFESEAEALSSVTNAAPGTPVKVYYDPKRPSLASLDRQGPSSHFFDAAAVLWLSLALLWFIYDRGQKLE